MIKENAKSKAKILYMGTPKMSSELLDYLIERGFNVVAVVTQEDRLVGRKQILTKTPVKEVAEKHNIPVYQPHKIRKDISFTNEINFNLIVTFAYGQIIPDDLLNIPSLGSINFHGSILPKYRGAAPIQRAIINKEKETGISLMKMVKEMDAGEVYAIERISIEEDDNYTSLCSKMSQAAKNIVDSFLEKYINGEISGSIQDESSVTFANKILPEDEKLDLNLDLRSFVAWVNGLSEEPGGYVYLDNQKLKIFKARSFDDSTIYPKGTLIIDKISKLQLSDGTVSLDLLQLQNKNVVDGKSFANGYKKYNLFVLK